MTIDFKSVYRLLIEYGLGYAVLWGSIIYLMKVDNVPVWVIVPFSLSVLILDIIAAKNQRIVAIFYTQRTILAGVVLLMSVLVAALILSGERSIDTLRAARFTTIITFFVEGFVVGAMVRTLFLAHFTRKLRGVDTDIQKLLLMVGLAVFVWLFPISQAHLPFGAVYLLGFGLGFYVHYMVRNIEHRFAQSVRQGQHIVQMFNSSRIHIEPVVMEAIRAYAHNRGRKLKSLLEDRDHAHNPPMTILYASALRRKGDYSKALKQIEHALAQGRPASEYRTTLLLLKALCHADLNERKDMYSALKSAIRLDNECLLAKVSLALRSAEELSVKDIGKRRRATQKESILEGIWKAVKLNELELSIEPFLSVIESSVPVTWTFLLDAYAYVLLKYGRRKFSKSLLLQCIYEDPIFSSPYLHLGEWYEYEAQTRIDRDGEHDKVKNLAKLCYHITICLEGIKDSLIKRRAVNLLRDLESVKQNSRRGS